MANFNKVILAGNLTRDPELRYTPKGTAVARIGLAVNRNWRSETGELREETTFVDVEAFGRQAETIGQYLKKGRPILIEGRLKLDQWDDKNTGQKQSKLRVVLENFQFLDSGPRSGGGGDSSNSSSSSSSRQRSSPPATSPEQTTEAAADSSPQEEDDVPF